MSKASKKRPKPETQVQGNRAADLSNPRGTSGDPPPSGDEAPRESPSMSQRAKMRGEIRDERRCTATARRTGERCRAPAILGGNVCRVHGGAAKQTKRKARERLLELVDPAIAALDRVLRDPEKDDNVKVRAALGILDRTGFRPGVVLEVNPGDQWSGLLNAVTAGADDRSGLLTEAATDALASENEAERVQGVLAEIDTLNREDAEARRETHVDNAGHTVVRATGDGTYSVFPARGEGPTDRRSEYDPTPPGSGAQTREQILLERLEEPDEEPGTWRSGH